MKCHICGAKMEHIITDLPFKTDQTSIIILKDLPVSQCSGCREYLLDDFVMEHVEEILEQTDKSAELEILNYPKQFTPALNSSLVPPREKAAEREQVKKGNMVL